MIQQTTNCTDELADDEIVAQFLKGEKILSDDAFRMLIERHGPMVLGVCRQVLGNEADADDAFQSTFLILSRKISTIRNRAILGAWLHEVAYRTAVKTRVRNHRRRSLERQNESMFPPSQFAPDSQHHDAAWNELRPVLHEEVSRLPQKYRVPVILSYLEGRTNEEVAALLNWPIGTVKGRLSRARELLRSRLTRRGLALSAAFLLMKLGDGFVLAEVVPPDLVEKTLVRVKRSKDAAGYVRTDDRASTKSRDSRGLRGMTKMMSRHTPGLLHPNRILVIVAFSILSAIGFAVALGSTPNRSSVEKSIVEYLLTRGGGATCH
jgi:RNA polymerase sigma factor (sigma-70 family)